LVTNPNSSGLGSLTQAVIQAQCDRSGSPVTIAFSSSLAGTTITPANTDASDPSSRLVVYNSNGESVQIDAPPGGVTISGGNTETVFHTRSSNAGGAVTLSGLTITQGHGYDGGAIYNEGSLTLDNCTVLNNSATNFGGGIDNVSSVSLNGGQLTGNSAIEGGGIYEQPAVSPSSPYATLKVTLNVNGTWFVFNSAKEGAGVENGVQDTATIDAAVLHNNSASVDGGAICNNGVLTVDEGSNIYLNSGDYGGGIENTGYLTVRGGSTLEWNWVFYDGGAIDCSAGTTTITGSQVYSNWSLSGGGVAIEGGTATINGNSTVEDNAADDGGGLYVSGGGVTVTGSGVTGNWANNGGGVAVEGGTATINGNSHVDHNSARNGGGIYDTNGPVTVDDGLVTYNSATTGGGIYNTANGTVNIVDFSQVGFNATPKDPNADGRGGGVYNGPGGYVTVSGCSVVFRNSAYIGGGVYQDESGTLLVNGGSVNVNQAVLGGGVFNSGSTTVEGFGVIDGNNASKYGGGIDNNFGGTVTITGDSWIESNTAFDGGGIFNDGVLSADSTAFWFNSASSEGGAIYNLDNLNGAATISHCTIFSNSAVSGGGLYLESGSTYLIGTTLSGNTATDGSANIGGPGYRSIK
jgi:hypothetical protein